MKKIIVDTNILFSALLKKETTCKTILTSDNYTLYSCSFMFVEIFKHKEKIKSKSKLNEDELLIQLEKALTCINFVSEEAIPTNIFYKAYMLCKDIDPNDIPFVALSLYLDGYLLTKDEKLANHLKEKGIQTITISDLMNFNT